MSRYAIWHAKKPTFGFGGNPPFPKGYDRVAVVRAESPDDAFRLTNHIDSNWTLNPEVEERLSERARSTSVGDVIEDLGTGETLVCGMIGWEPLKQRA